MDSRLMSLLGVEWRIVQPQPRRDDTSGRKDLHLAELLDFRPDQGIIRLHEQRVVILSAAAMGLPRKELIDTLGLETARHLAIRFGFADGYHDAVSLRDRSNWADPVEGIRAGAVLQTLEGIVRADVRTIEYDVATGRFEEEVRPSLREDRCACLLVPGGVRKRFRRRVPRQGDLFSREVVRSTGRQAMRRHRARRRELGR
jgi:activator of aromatic catabolism